MPQDHHTILHILAGLGYGGNESVALRLIQSSPVNVQHYLLVLDASKQEQYQDFIPHSQAIFYGPTPLAYGNIFHTATKVLRQTQPTAIISYTFNSKVLPIGLAAKLQGLGNMHIHVGNTAPVASAERLKWQGVLWAFWGLGVPVYPCSKAVMDSIKGLASLATGSRVIINGCDIQAIATRASASRHQRPPNDPQRIIMVARLDEIKDQATLIRAFRQLQPRYPGWQLWLVGEGSERSRLEHLATQLGLDPQAIFLGQRGDIPELLGQADIFAFSTTEAEGFGIVLIEAMAAGLPILASDVNACREVLMGGKAGQLLLPGNLNSWVNSLDSMMGDNSQRQIWAQASLSASSQYDMRIYNQKWLDVLCPNAI